MKTTILAAMALFAVGTTIASAQYDREDRRERNEQRQRAEAREHRERREHFERDGGGRGEYCEVRARQVRRMEEQVAAGESSHKLREILIATKTDYLRRCR